MPRAHDGGGMWRHTAPTAPASSALQARACGNYRAVAVAAARTWLPSRGGENGRNRFQKHVEGKREGSEGEASGCGSEGELRCMMKERALRKLRYDFILTRKSMR